VGAVRVNSDPDMESACALVALPPSAVAAYRHFGPRL